MFSQLNICIGLVVWYRPWLICSQCFSYKRWETLYPFLECSLFVHHNIKSKINLLFSIIRHMDTSLCDVDVQPTYVKVTLKGKVSFWAVDAVACWGHFRMRGHTRSQVKVMGCGLWNGTCCLVVIAGATYLVHCLCDSFEDWATIDKIYRCSMTW